MDDGLQFRDIEAERNWTPRAVTEKIYRVFFIYVSGKSVQLETTDKKECDAFVAKVESENAVKAEKKKTCSWGPSPVEYVVEIEEPHPAPEQIDLAAHLEKFVPEEESKQRPVSTEKRRETAQPFVSLDAPITQEQAEKLVWLSNQEYGYKARRMWLKLANGTGRYTFVEQHTDNDDEHKYKMVIRVRPDGSAYMF